MTGHKLEFSRKMEEDAIIFKFPCSYITSPEENDPDYEKWGLSELPVVGEEPNTPHCYCMAKNLVALLKPNYLDTAMTWTQNKIAYKKQCVAAISQVFRIFLANCRIDQDTVHQIKRKNDNSKRARLFRSVQLLHDEIIAQVWSMCLQAHQKYDERPWIFFRIDKNQKPSDDAFYKLANIEFPNGLVTLFGTEIAPTVELEDVNDAKTKKNYHLIDVIWNFIEIFGRNMDWKSGPSDKHPHTRESEMLLHLAARWVQSNYIAYFIRNWSDLEADKRNSALQNTIMNAEVEDYFDDDDQSDNEPEHDQENQLEHQPANELEDDQEDQLEQDNLEWALRGKFIECSKACIERAQEDLARMLPTATFTMTQHDTMSDMWIEWIKDGDTAFNQNIVPQLESFVYAIDIRSVEVLANAWHPSLRKFHRQFMRRWTLQLVIKLRKSFESRYKFDEEHQEEYSRKSGLDEERQNYGLFSFQFDNQLLKQWVLDYVELGNQDPMTDDKVKRFRLPTICWFRPDKVPPEQANTPKNAARLAYYESIFKPFYDNFITQLASHRDGSEPVSIDQVYDVFQCRACMAWFECVFAAIGAGGIRPPYLFKSICNKHGIWTTYNDIDELINTKWNPHIHEPWNAYTQVFASNMGNPYLIQQ